MMEGSSFCYCYTILSMIIITFLFALSADAAVHSIITDAEALLALKNHITWDPNQILVNNWSASAGSSICEWTGVTCGKRHYRVTALDISGFGLTGTIVPQLGNLSFLVSLNLSHNNFHGDIPSQLSKCSRLRDLGLQFNNISGHIPKGFWNMQLLHNAFFANNSLEGTIPKEVGNLTSLRRLYLVGNRISGTIPKELSNLTNLEELSLDSNNLSGTIPEEFHNLQNLKYLQLGFNGLEGSVPAGIFNISTLIDLELHKNYLSGRLPSTMGSLLPNLEYFIVSYNMLSGVLPVSISNASRLQLLEMNVNNFHGIIPHSLGSLRYLRYIGLAQNMFTKDPSSLELIFLTSLANCNNLKRIDLSYNPLNGVLPKSIGNLSKSVEFIYANSNGISSGIPEGIGNLSNLFFLDLSYNHLTGSLPASIASLHDLQYLSLGGNRLYGSLTCNLFDLQRLGVVYLHDNLFLGPIPECIGNCSSLRNVWLYSNKLNSHIPMNLWNLKDLLELDLSSNFLNNSLSVQVGNLHVVIKLDLSMNNISGNIPDAIGNLQNLVNLNLSCNIFQGSIPNSIGKIVSLENLDLSKNKLSGSIPTTLGKLRYLKGLNVSYNNLVGLIPSGRPFVNFTASSFMFNKDLCGDKMFHVPPCRTLSVEKSWIKGPKHIILVCFGLVALIAATTLVVVYRRKNKTQKSEALRLVSKDRISFYELQHATDGYSERNLLGQGSFGSVYKATLKDGRVVAIKVFNLQGERGFKSFDIECEVLRNLRHRNLTQVISTCSNSDFKAIVLEFMPNGSLENWLHSMNHFLSFTERLSIMIDVACALDYLHSGYATPVVHADLKPSNVLLDESKVAHVSDFGIAKMLGERSITYTNTLGTFGYIAPEYGSEGLVSTKCDVYSFGIMLMEVFTSKSTSDEIFNESLTLHDWVGKSIESGALAEIIEDGLLNTAKEEHLVLECMRMIMNVALNCTKAFPRERHDIGEVLANLNKIKHKLKHIVK